MSSTEVSTNVNEATGTNVVSPCQETTRPSSDPKEGEVQGTSTPDESSSPATASNVPNQNNDVVILTMGPTLQDKINALHGNKDVRVLKLVCHEDSSDTKKSFSLVKIRLPNLEEFHCLNVYLDRLTLTKTLTPKLKVLCMDNPIISYDPKFSITCPTIKRVSLNYCAPGHAWVPKLLKAATQLEEFSSYKLIVGSTLKFASNELRSLTIHRSDCLNNLEIWAPRLELLNLQACYDLNDINFLSTHPLVVNLEPQFKHRVPLVVTAENAALGERALEAISRHPRVTPANAKRLQDQADAWLF